MRKVTVKPHIFSDREAIRFDMIEGSTIETFIAKAKLPEALRQNIRADVNGVLVLDFDTRLESDDLVNIYVVPMGGDSGKGIMRLVATIAIVVSAGALAPIAGAALGLTSAGAMAGLTAAFSAVGMMAMNALIPLPSLDTGGYSGAASSANAYTITGQSNTISLYGVVPRLYGTHRFFPRLCVQPLITNINEYSSMTAVYDFGYAAISISDVRLGVTSLDNFDTETNILPKTFGDDLILFSHVVNTQAINLKLSANNTIVRETAEDTNGTDIEIAFPKGLFLYSDDRDYLDTAVDVEIAYRVAGSSDALSYENMKNYGAGIINQGQYKDIEVLLELVNVYIGDSGFSQYLFSTENTTTLRVNSLYDLSVGDMITNNNFVFNFGGRESRRVTQHAFAGNDIEVSIDRPFTNFSKTTSVYDGDPFKYFQVKFYDAVSGLKIENNIINAFTVKVNILFPHRDKWEVHVKRITPDSDEVTLVNETFWGLFRSYSWKTPMQLDTEHTLLELSLRATEQINGVVENLNALCRSWLLAYNGTTFINLITDNPAWIVMDILIGDANAGALDWRQLDLDNFLEFANYCDELVTVKPEGQVTYTEKRHRSSFVVTAPTTVNDMVQSVLSQARATLKIGANGKYGILFDVEKTQPVQLFTTRNSFGFSSERTYADLPHALKVKYINSSLNYEMDEVIVYADGYNFGNATKFETVETFGVTHYAEAWRHGRYTLAQMIAYQEVFTLSVDLEHLSVQRGELVSVQNDVPRIGGLPLRVKQVLDGGLTIVLNDALTYDGVSEYHYLVRADDLNIQTGEIAAVVGLHTVELLVANPNIRERDVFVYGIKDYVTKDYLVKTITPTTDLKATLTLLPYNEDVYSADIGDMPIYESGISPELENDCAVEIEDLEVDYSLTYENRQPIPNFNITWNVASAGTVAKYLVEWANASLNGRDYTAAGYTEDTNYRFVLGNLVDNPQLIGKNISFRVTPISVTNASCIPSSSVEVKVVPDETIPADVTFFNCNVVSETLNLTWESSGEPDVMSYTIKFNASLDSSVATWNRSVILTDKVAHDTLRHTTNARKGTYLIKAVDSSGNISAEASRAITSIPEIVNLNFVESLEDSPEWGGIKDNLFVEGGILKTKLLTAVGTCEFTMCDGWWRDSKIWSDSITWLDVPIDYGGTEYAKEGKYSYSDMIDLGDIYTVRISTDIGASANKKEEVMHTWERLSDITALATTKDEMWNAYIVLKVASELGGIAKWVLLSDVDAMSDDSTQNWTEEALSEMGDFTGRYFRFYLYAKTQFSNIQVNINHALVTVDMPDRIISENDLLSSASNFRVHFSPAFYVTPALSITQDNASKGDRYVITNKDKTGFNVEFFDVNDTTVSRQFDYMAKAYGSLTNELIKLKE